MNPIRYALLLIFVFVGAQQLGAKDSSSPIPTDLSALRYNPVSKSYEAHLVTVTDQGSAIVFMCVFPDGHRIGLNIKNGKTAPFLTVVDKYLEWEKLARERGDNFTKKIASIDYISGTLVYAEFQSVAKGRHVLSFSIRSKLLGESFVSDDIADLKFGREDAEKFRSLLVTFEAGTLGKKSIDEVYK